MNLFFLQASYDHKTPIEYLSLLLCPGLQRVNKDTMILQFILYLNPAIAYFD